jgi:hypothetical protein
MKRQTAGLVLMLLTLTGCEPLRHNLRRRDSAKDDAVSRAVDDEHEGEQVLDVRSSHEKPRPFFKSSRLPSGLSSEAREIEGDLGIR